MTKKRLIPAAMLVALAAILIVLNWSSIARAAGFTFTYGSSNPLSFVGGVTQSAAKALPAKMNADGDGVTGHLVVDCSTGCSGGGGSSFPYNAATGGQTAQTASFLGIAGWNGTTVDPIATVNGGTLKVGIFDEFNNGAIFQAGSLQNALYNISGNPITTTAAGADAVSNTANSVNVNAWNYMFNGTTWDRLEDDGSKNLKVNVNAALPAGTNTIGTVNGLLTGLNSTGTAGAAGQAFVQDCNFTTAPATVTTGDVVPVSCNNKAQQIVDTQSVAGSAVTTSTGLAGQYISPANTSGGRCQGINVSTGTQVTRVNLAPVTVTASEAATQIVAAVASKFVHVCSVTISGVLSTGGAVNLITGTGVNCVTTPTTLATYQFGVNAAGFMFDKGNGEESFIDSITAGEICVSSGAFVSTQAVTLDLVYSQY